MKLNQSAEFKEMFLVVIQLGAILCSRNYVFNKLNPFSKKKTKEQQKDTINMWLKVIVGVIPAGVLGVLFDKTLEKIFYNFPTVAFTLVLYGILFIVVENNPKFKNKNVKRFEDLSYSLAFYIGCFQVLSLIPGTSRSGSYDSWSVNSWTFKEFGSRIFILYVNSCDVWSKFVKT